MNFPGRISWPLLLQPFCFNLSFTSIFSNLDLWSNVDRYVFHFLNNFMEWMSLKELSLILELLRFLTLDNLVDTLRLGHRSHTAFE